MGLSWKALPYKNEAIIRKHPTSEMEEHMRSMVTTVSSCSSVKSAAIILVVGDVRDLGGKKCNLSTVAKLVSVHERLEEH